MASGEGGGAERSEGKTDSPSTLNKLPPHRTPAFLMPGTDRGLERQIWKAVFTQGSRKAKCLH